LFNVSQKLTYSRNALPVEHSAESQALSSDW
jgi:hypothetical protein